MRTSCEAIVAAWVAQVWRGAHLEVGTPSGGRCDVVFDGVAVEVESVDTWAHGLGQALRYGTELGLRPGLLVYGSRLERRLGLLDLVRDVAQGVGCRVWVLGFSPGEPLGVPREITYVSGCDGLSGVAD